MGKPTEYYDPLAIPHTIMCTSSTKSWNEMTKNYFRVASKAMGIVFPQHPKHTEVCVLCAMIGSQYQKHFAKIVTSK